MVFTAFYCIRKKFSHPNNFLLTWGERGALPDIQTSGRYGRAFFLPIKASPIEWYGMKILEDVIMENP